MTTGVPKKGQFQEILWRKDLQKLWIWNVYERRVQDDTNSLDEDSVFEVAPK